MPSEWRPSFPCATWAIRVSKTLFQSSDQAMGSTVGQNVARSTKLGRNLLNRSCHALSRAIRVTTFLFTCFHVLDTCLYVLTRVKCTPPWCHISILISPNYDIIHVASTVWARIVKKKKNYDDLPASPRRKRKIDTWPLQEWFSNFYKKVIVEDMILPMIVFQFP